METLIIYIVRYSSVVLLRRHYSDLSVGTILQCTIWYYQVQGKTIIGKYDNVIFDVMKNIIMTFMYLLCIVCGTYRYTVAMTVDHVCLYT